MAASRCTRPPWATCKRIKLQHTGPPPSKAAISSSTSFLRAHPIDDASLENQIAQTALRDESASSAQANDNSPSRDSPIKVQDQIKSDLVNIARERNIYVPGVLDPKSDAKISRLPRAVQALYLAPMRRPVTHGHPVANLQLRSYSVRNLEFMADFAMRAAYYLNLPARGPVALPRITERWTVPKSNFVHKKSQENWERITTRRLVQVLDGDVEVVRRWLAYMRKNCWYGVGMKADVFEWEDLNVAQRMDAAADKAGQANDRVRWELYGKRKGEATATEVNKLLDEQGFGSSQPAAPAASKKQPPPPTKKEARPKRQKATAA